MADSETTNVTNPKITIDFRVVDDEYNSSSWVMTKVFMNDSELFTHPKSDGSVFELKDGKFKIMWSSFHIKDMCKSLEQYQFRWIDIGKEPVVFTYAPCKEYEDHECAKYGNYFAESGVYGKIQVTVCLNWLRNPTIYFQC